MSKGSSNSGFTLVEITIVLTIVSIMLTFAIPQFRLALEQSKSDMAQANLQAVWSAQRIYWAENKTFAADIDTLEKNGFLDPGFTSRNNKQSAPYLYSVIFADETSFQASAARRNSVAWKGSLLINELGVVSGYIQGRNTKIYPTDI